MTFDVDINDLSDISYLIARDCIVVDVGNTFSEMTGYSSAEILQKNITEVIVDLLRINSTVFDLENSPLDKPVYLFTMQHEVREVSVQVITKVFPFEKIYLFFEKADSRLEQKLPMAEKLLTDNRLGIAIYSSPELDLLKVNQAYINYINYNNTGCKKENIIGLKIRDLINWWGIRQAQERFAEVINTGNTVYAKEIKKGSDPNKAKFFDETIIPVMEDEKVKFIISMVEDVTERIVLRQKNDEQAKLATRLKGQPDASLLKDITGSAKKQEEASANQIALLKAEKEALEKAIEMKDEFLSFITHEFRTPITVVNSALQAIELLCKDEMSEKLKKYIGNIKQNTLRQLRLVNNFLDITRINAGRVKINRKNIDIVFLTKAITESVHLYAQQKEITLTFHSAIGSKVIGIDDEKYERILLNLLSNAIKFTPKGELITVKLGSAGGKINIEVKDTGPGIPQDKLGLIFERFGQVDNSLTRQAEGTGIGLSLVKLLVEALDGSISVKSKVGKGSTFTILLPAVKAPEDKNAKTLIEIADNRLIQATSIEFSDVYL